MKKIYILLLLTFFGMIALTKDAHAVVKTTPSVSPDISITATPSGTQNPDLMNKIDQQINNLKTKIASRVAQLNLVEKRGMIGTVVQTSGTEIQLTDQQNNIRFVDVDELTKFSSSSAKDIGISDLTKGTIVGVLGNYNKESKRILARFVDVLTFPQTYSGIVDSVDSKNYQFNITTLDQKTKLIDVGNITKTSAYSADTGLKKAGFSKIQTDQRVYVVGFPDKTDPNKIIASRIILLTNLAQSSSSSATLSPTSTKKK
ncbi:MAG TPA: hypothetical protein VLG12_08595 [Candidatus Saccharimonadales bacterium]|nr:hypothetical protein [Candidatus Saccharimonadales bacterium]